MKIFVKKLSVLKNLAMKNLEMKILVEKIFLLEELGQRHQQLQNFAKFDHVICNGQFPCLHVARTFSNNQHQ